MATDWIKIEKTTPRKSEVLRIATILGIHPDHAFGLCFRFWTWCDDNMLTANAGGVSLALVDSLVDRNGFCDAMVKVGWLKPTGETFEVTKFERHLSKSAKSRGLTAKRVAKHERKTNDRIVSEPLIELELELDSNKKTAPTHETIPPVEITPTPESQPEPKQVPAPAAKPKNHGMWGWIKNEDLHDVGKIINWFNRVSKGKHPLIGSTETDRLNVVAAAVHSWTNAEDPHKLFCWIIHNREFGCIKAIEEDTAYQMVKEYLHQEDRTERKGKVETVGETLRGMFPEVAT